MNKSICCCVVLSLSLLVLSPRGQAGEFGGDPPTDSIGVGFDLFQVARPFVPGQPPQTTPAPVATLNGIDFVDHPLGTFDFGTGPLDVGGASIITQRNHPADNGDDGGGFGGGVSIEILEFSLRSADPVDVGGGVSDFVYTTLSETPGARRTGGFDFEFHQFFPPDSGDVNSRFHFEYDVRVGSPTGAIIDTQEFDLRTQFAVPWRHFPNELSPTVAPDHVIAGVNFQLEDTPFGNADFFLAPGNNVLTMHPIRIFEEKTLLAVEHANAIGPGGTADNPILPDLSEGGFTFINVPSAGWFDPPATSGYEYATDGASQFTAIYLPTLVQVPDGDGFYEIVTSTSSTQVSAGSFHFFPTGGVDDFRVLGINPTVDGADPLAFPVFLQFNQPSNTFTQTPIPEPTTLVLAMLATPLLIRRYRTR